MTLSLIFLVNAALSFALSLLLAALLGPDGFGRYAVALAVTVVINTALFEWLRLSTTRSYSERIRTEDPGVRATLDRAYLLTAAALAALATGAGAIGLDLGLSAGLFAAACGCGLTYGVCEYQMALARARFLERPYAVLVLGRGVGGFVFAAGAAVLSGNPALVLAGAAAAAALVSVIARPALADPMARGAPVRQERLAAFARYGLPLVLASAMYQLIPLLNRTLLAGREGFAEAGYFSLASEIGTRLFQNLGSALDLVLFQLAVRAEELHGRAEAERQVARNAGVVAAIVLPAAFGFAAVWPAFEAVFVPGAFRGRVEGATLALIPALACFALVQYALNPVFQLRRRTGAVVAAAAVALAVDVVAVTVWPRLPGPEGFAVAQLAGFAAGLVVIGGLALAAGARLPWRDLALSLLASATMAAALLPLRALGPPLLVLGVQVVAGALLYGGLALMLDIVGAGRFLRDRAWGRRPART